MTRDQAARIFILTLLAWSIYLLYLIFQPFLSAIAWAGFLAIAFYPVYRKLVKMLRGREWMASLLTTGSIVSLMILPGTVLIISLADGVGPLLSSFIEKVRESTQSGFTSQFTFLAKIEAFLRNYINISEIKLHDALVATIERLGQSLSQQIHPLLENTLRTVMAFLVMIFVMTFLFRQGPLVIEGVRRFLPVKEKDKEAAFKRLTEVSNAIFYGVMLTALVQALLGLIGWAFVGLPNPTVFGIAMFFCALVPVLGTALVWVPGAIYLYTQGETAMTVVLILWGVLVISMVDNFMKPIFISGRARLPMLLVFFGIFGGITAFGLKGLFLGPAVITLFLFLSEVVRRDLFSAER
jgi:predicted PurR-regulated permease PerM